MHSNTLYPVNPADPSQTQTVSAANSGIPLAQFDQTGQGGGPFGYLSQTNGSVALTQVSPDDLMSDRLNEMMSGNSPFVRHAADNANAYAGARGAGADSSIYQAGAVNSLYDQLSPIAQADAQRYADVANRNQAALNDYNLQRIQAAAQTTAAAIGVSYRGAELEEQRRQFDQSQQNRQQDRQWQLADQRAAARANQRSTTFNTLLQSVFSDPSYWRDPQGAMGMFNTYMSNIPDMLDNLFPEYAEQPGDGYAGGTP
jgi:hypothetical protein